MSHQVRTLGLVLAVCALVACAGPPRPAQPVEEDAESRESSTGEPTAPERSAEADEPARAPPATGIAAIEERRMALAAGENAMARESVGYFMDVHEARLRQSLGEAITMRREEMRFRLSIPGSASFKSGAVQVRESLASNLEKLAGILVEFDKTLIVVNAHTDSAGKADFNLSLSNRRALGVAEVLVDHGVDPGRIVAVGHGESDPISDNSTASGRAANRRLEIIIEPVIRGDVGQDASA